MRAGELVIYRMNKHSASPGRRAKNLRPSGAGDTYSYQVDKYWVVVDELADGRLEIATRTGKRRVIEPTDACLRPAKWWERWWYAKRFPNRQDFLAQAS